MFSTLRRNPIFAEKRKKEEEFCPFVHFIAKMGEMHEKQFVFVFVL
jgi:hypothetical protein